jgi:predicted transcriptional regulator
MSENAEEEWYLLAYVLSSKYRVEILKKMKNSPVTPSELSKELNCPLSRVSGTLRDLEKVNLVICLTPERSKGRLYKLTEKGEKILKRILSEYKTFE